MVKEQRPTPSPRSCGGACEGVAEALTGARAGRVLSRERSFLRSADAVRRRGRRNQHRRCRETLLGSARSATPSPYGNTMVWEPGNPVVAHGGWRHGPCREVQGRTPTMNDHRKSDRPAVLAKSPNKAERSAAEEMEGRGLAKGNLPEQNAARTQRRSDAHSALELVLQAPRCVADSASAPKSWSGARSGIT